MHRQGVIPNDGDLLRNGAAGWVCFYYFGSVHCCIKVNTVRISFSQDHRSAFNGNPQSDGLLGCVVLVAKQISVGCTVKLRSNLSKFGVWGKSRLRSADDVDGDFVVFDGFVVVTEQFVHIV